MGLSRTPFPEDFACKIRSYIGPFRWKRPPQKCHPSAVSDLTSFGKTSFRSPESIQMVMNKSYRPFRLLSAVVLAIAAATSLPVFALPDHIVVTDKDKFTNWTLLGPNGGDVRAVAIDPKDKDHVYISTLDGQIYHSTNAGGSWQLLVNLDEPQLILDNFIIDANDS